MATFPTNVLCNYFVKIYFRVNSVGDGEKEFIFSDLYNRELFSQARHTPLPCTKLRFCHNIYYVHRTHYSHKVLYYTLQEVYTWMCIRSSIPHKIY